MRFPLLAGTACALLLSVTAVAQTPASDFSADRFRSHVTFLADDLLEGRDTGTRGYDVAALYVATQMKGLGLTPGNGESWYQEVPFVQFGAGETPPTLTIGGRSFAQGQDILVRQSPARGDYRLDAPVVFAGYGLDAPGQGLDDYAGLDVEGRVVAVLSGVPAGLPSDVSAHLNREKARMAEARGAVGMIVLRTRAEEERFPWARMAAMGAGGGGRALTWVGTDGAPYVDAPGIGFTATLGPDAAEALFAGGARPLSAVLGEAAREGAKPRGFALTQSVSVTRPAPVTTDITSRNVVAVLPGSDPELAGEYVLLMAHLDGLGIDPRVEDGNNIRNGAMDNATGVSTMIEVARQMASAPNRPRRSILFAAVTAEERGLLGAQYLARNPVVDGRVVGVVNLDMPVLLYDFQDVIAFGAEHSTMGDAVTRAGAGMGVATTPDPLPQEGLFTRSDHYMFVREGIPAVFLMTGFAGEGEARFTGFLGNEYHSVRDDLNLPFNWQAGAKFAELNYRIAREIADADEAPSWRPDSVFARPVR